MKVSAIILFSTIDNEFLPDCLLSLPKWAKPLIFKTDQGEKEEVRELRNDEHLQLYEYKYTSMLDFSRARNIAKGLCDADWIISIDADERLDPFQHEWLWNLLHEVPEDIGGIAGTQWSFCANIPNPENKERALRLAVPTVRVFRNLPPFQWRFPIHEVIDPAIVESGYRILDTKLNILHEGYSLPVERMKEKLWRNIRGIVENPEILEQKRYQDYLINSCVMLKHLGG